VSGRLAVLIGDGAVDVESASGGRFPSDPDAVFDRWDELADWVAELPAGRAVPYRDEQLGAPVLRPAQVFGVGLNYREHAAEAGLAPPSEPAVFTKFRTCLTGPYDRVRLPSGQVDWEVELVVVIGREAYRVSEDRGWSYVAGLCVGQDLSERTVQLVGPVPQFSLGKSYPGFGPVGPAIVTPDELVDPDDLELACQVDDEVLQKGRTSDMIFGVPELVARLSTVCPLLPGDLIFTGTPPGVGMARSPQRFLTPGTTLVSTVAGLGELRNPLC
jgi:2-keto-4-pentenoate hydratase/2-oxohepta-3-ene-1,7-dioic acid hydratase in catechol pathway